LNGIRKKILIVEDEGIIAIDLKRKLVQAGYLVTAVASDAAEAMAALEQELPDLVLMDIRLRGPEDGIQTAERVRQRFRLPIMFVTAHADSETLERAKITEPFGYIVKPFAGVNFQAQIEMALWKHLMEQRLRASEAWLSTTFRNVADALITTDAKGNIVLMNSPAAKLTGWNSEEARGQELFAVFKVFDEKTQLPIVHPLDEIYEGRQVDASTSILNLAGRDNTSVLVEAEITANRDDCGSFFGIICVFRDITDRRKAEERERQLQKKNAITLLATGLAGELAKSQARMDEPLTHLIREAKGQTLRMLGEIYQCSTHQRVLVQQLGDLGRTESGRPVVVDLNGTVTAMEDQFRKVLGRSRPLNLDLQPELPLIEVEGEELRENLLRLVIEAREAMPDGGAVDITTKSVSSGDGGYRVQLAVRDNGKRIRPDARVQMFDPYSQFRSGKRNAGLALALVYQFVALNGGSIDVEIAPGLEKGTTFVLSFPALENSRSPSPSDERHMAVSG
jgi:two-component system cell cycle sensor histidine kinase/response regulator CckA